MIDRILQELDINELCNEFTAKAKCDGSKVVLEPAGIASILNNMSKLVMASSRGTTKTSSP